jgi:multicomponent Na+:H+ antiporter subunit C
MSYLPYVVAAWLFVIGLYGIVTSRHFVHLVQSLAIVQSSTYVLLTAIAYRRGGIEPYFADRSPASTAVDPVAHTLMLVDIVIEAAVTALFLALALKAHEDSGQASPDKLEGVRG